MTLNEILVDPSCSRERALIFAKLSRHVYVRDREVLNPVEYGFDEEFKIIIDRKTDTECIVLFRKERREAAVVFVGTNSIQNFINNFHFPLHELPHLRLYGKFKVHDGFAEQYMAVRDRIILQLRKNKIEKIFTAGHSLGGSLAQILALDVKLTGVTSMDSECFTYGAPRTGNSSFANKFNKCVPKSYRFVNLFDPVPYLPFMFLTYRHPGTKHNIGCNFVDISHLKNHRKKLAPFLNFLCRLVLGTKIRYVAKLYSRHRARSYIEMIEQGCTPKHLHSKH